MFLEEFQDGHPGGHFGYRDGRILAILNLCVTAIPSSFSSVGLRVWEEMLFEEFQEGRRLGYRNGKILNLCVTAMPPIKFQLHQT